MSDDGLESYEDVDENGEQKNNKVFRHKRPKKVKPNWREIPSLRKTPTCKADNTGDPERPKTALQSAHREVVCTRRPQTAYAGNSKTLVKKTSQDSLKGKCMFDTTKGKMEAQPIQRIIHPVLTPHQVFQKLERVGISANCNYCTPFYIKQRSKVLKLGSKEYDLWARMQEIPAAFWEKYEDQDESLNASMNAGSTEKKASVAARQCKSAYQRPVTSSTSKSSEQDAEQQEIETKSNAVEDSTSKKCKLTLRSGGQRPVSHYGHQQRLLSFLNGIEDAHAIQVNTMSFPEPDRQRGRLQQRGSGNWMSRNTPRVRSAAPARPQRSQDSKQDVSGTWNVHQTSCVQYHFPKNPMAIFPLRTVKNIASPT